MAAPGHVLSAGSCIVRVRRVGLYFTGITIGLALSAIGAEAGTFRHAVAGLESTRLYDVLLNGDTFASGVQPDLEGVLVFDLTEMGNVQVVDVGQGDREPPSDITDLVVVSSGDRSLTLEWTAPGDDGDEGTAAAYEIRWATSSEELGDMPYYDPAPPAPSPSGTTERYTLGSLPAAATIYVSIRARDDRGLWNAWSNEVQGATAGGEADEDPPGPVADLETTWLGGTSATLAWTAPGDDGMVGRAAAYEIRWALSIPDLQTDFTLDASPPSPADAGTPETHTLKGLPPAATIFFALRTRDDAGNWSELSNVASGTTVEDGIPPATITDFEVLEIESQEVILAWRAPGDDGMNGQAARYDCRYSLAPLDASNFTSGTPVPGIDTPQAPGGIEIVTVSGLLPETTYYFAVVTLDDAGNESPVSENVSALTRPGTAAPITPPPAPTAGYQTGAVEVRWNPSGNPAVVGYHVYRRMDGAGEPETRVTDNPLPGVDYVDSDVTEGRAYYYRVTSVDIEENESPHSDATWIRALAGVPTAPYFDRIYPNPVVTQATFRFGIPEVGPGHPEGQQVTIELYDVAGRRVASIFEGYVQPGVQEVVWRPGQSGATFVPGLYLSVLRAGSQRVVERLAVGR